MGLENFHSFLANYDIKSTLFMVGNDFKNSDNHAAIRAMCETGHEIANHSMTHPQGFRLLPSQEKEFEIAAMENICLQVTGRRPEGFRSPGWNISDDTLPILKRRGYLYDSSVNPTVLVPLLKCLHWYTMRGTSRENRTTLGHLYYMFAPTRPYQTSRKRLGSRGHGGLIELPLTVTPVFRLPFWATSLLALGPVFFKTSYNLLKSFGFPIQLQFHLSDFVDYRHPELVDQMPQPKDGVYIPQALNKKLSTKISFYRKILDILTADYRFYKLADWPGQFHLNKP
jgi:peptidoglycan/xylan/chitin deacetylase (PgdA/CDA1 family)